MSRRFVAFIGGRGQGKTLAAVSELKKMSERKRTYTRWGEC